MKGTPTGNLWGCPSWVPTDCSINSICALIQDVDGKGASNLKPNLMAYHLDWESKYLEL